MNETELGSELSTLDEEASDISVGSPSVTFESLTFSDGSAMHLDPTDVVVLVGPNNAGKSAALRELDEAIANNHHAVVLKSFALNKEGTKEEFQNFVKKHAQVRRRGRSWELSGYHWSVSLSNGGLQQLQQFWPEQLNTFRQMFCLRMPTETRITGSNPPKAINHGEETLNHPIHILVDDDELEMNISTYFHRAFGKDLILNRTPSRNISLLVGTRPVLDSETGEDRLSKSYRKRVIAHTNPLAQEGDGMRSFASVILHLLAPITASILLLDEPEAFLHPPQARLLGEIIAVEKSSRAQLFVATHSPDVLQDLVNVASDRLRLLRIQREGNINRIKELDKEIVKRISSDPVMNYSSVLSGVFHKRVIICEADGDCMFYSSMLELEAVHGEGHPDVLFVHAGGKDRMAILAQTLRDLDVPVDVVADIDILREESGLQRTIEALGGDWSRVRQSAKIVRTAVNDSKPGLSIDQVKQEIEATLSQDLPDGDPVTKLRSDIDTIFRRVSPWDTVKQSGESAIPKGQATQNFQELLDICKETGLWIVPVGEMEGFCRSIGKKGPRWVQHVIEDKDLATDPDLERARAFVREIWESKL